MHGLTERDPNERVMRLRRTASPLLFALGLFALNSLGVLSGWFATPAGHVHLLQMNTSDNAIYLSWLRSSASRFLHPDFQAPWLTESAVFQPLLVAIARLSPFAGLSVEQGFALAHLGLYIAAAYALFAALRHFMPTSTERNAALGVMLLSVPIPSLLLLPSLVLPLDRLGIPSLPGLGFFVWRSSDGFLHGISGSILVTYGTAATVASFAFLAAFMQTKRRPYLAGACATTLACGLVHPYEPFLIVPAGSLALLLWKQADWRRAIPDVAALCIAGGLGIAPTALLALTTPWVRDAAAITRWSPPNPAVLLAALGLPTLVATVLLVTRRRMASPSDLLLQCWVGCTLVGLYVPFIPWTQHLLDGFLVGVAMLLVRQLGQAPEWKRIWVEHRGIATATIAALAVLSVGASSAYYWQSWKDGRAPVPERLFSSVVPQDDVAARDWLAEHAEYSDLVLAPVTRATWFSSVPMHSVAGNRLFSITYDEQARLSDDFFEGRMTRESADTFLSRYGVRWVVLPAGGPLGLSPSRATARARLGTWTVLEIEGNAMKPYPGISR